MDRQKLQGYLFGILTALCWATSPVFIARGLREFPSSIWATAIGLFFASLIYSFGYIQQKKWLGIPEIKKKHLIWQAVAGIAAGLGILSRNLALDTTRVAIVIGLLQISALFTLILAPIILGRGEKEQITLKLVFGVLLIIGGSILIIYGRNL